MTQQLLMIEDDTRLASMVLVWVWIGVEIGPIERQPVSPRNIKLIQYVILVIINETTGFNNLIFS